MKAQAQATARCECLEMCTAGNRPVILREFQRGEKVNAWICAQRATDRDPQSFNVNAWKCAQRATDRDLESALQRECLNMCTQLHTAHFY